MFLKFHKVQGKTPEMESLFNKTPAEVISLEFWKNFKNTLFTEHVWMTLSAYPVPELFGYFKKCLSSLCVSLSSIP